MIVIPTDATAASYSEVVTLGGSDFNLTFNWNEREGFWYMDIADAASEPILSGLKIVADWDLTSRFTDSRLPDGRIITIDQTGGGADPGRDDLGGRVLLIFVETSELIPQ